MMSFDRASRRELDAETQGNVSEMARRSGLQRHHVRTNLKRLGIRETGEG
jgi:transcriptional regulator of acetoin/glycerol metabolism